MCASGGPKPLYGSRRTAGRNRFAAHIRMMDVRSASGGQLVRRTVPMRQSCAHRLAGEVSPLVGVGDRARITHV